MKIPSFLSVAFIAAHGLVSCATSSPNQEFKQNGAIVHYQLPEHWTVLNVEEPTDYFHIIKPANAKSPSDPSVTIDFYDEFNLKFPRTEKGCADGYLFATQDQKDPMVRMSKAGSIVSPIYGEISLFRYFSDYYGDHLIAFIVTKNGYVAVELWTKTAAEREKHKESFQGVVRSLSITPD